MYILDATQAPKGACSARYTEQDRIYPPDR